MVACRALVLCGAGSPQDVSHWTMASLVPASQRCSAAEAASFSVQWCAAFPDRARVSACSAAVYHRPESVRLSLRCPLRL